MENKEIRWKQRFQNYEMAFLKLKEAIAMNYQTIKAAPNLRIQREYCEMQYIRNCNCFISSF